MVVVLELSWGVSHGRDGLSCCRQYFTDFICLLCNPDGLQSLISIPRPPTCTFCSSTLLVAPYARKMASDVQCNFKSRDRVVATGLVDLNRGSGRALCLI